MIRTHKVTITLVGAAGSATGTATTPEPVNGLLKGLYIARTGQPATVDVTISTQQVPVKTLLTASNLAADAWYYPHSQGQDGTGTAIAGVYFQHAIDGYLSVLCAQGDAGTVTVYALIEAD